jgi:acid stress-induced BolA-like protein IbaG/YrbA
MFSAERIREILESALPGCQAVINSDDGVHFQAAVTASSFAGKTRIQQHQLVYGALGDHMRSDIHALELKTYSPDAWPHGQGAR